MFVSANIACPGSNTINYDGTVPNGIVSMDRIA